MLLPATTLLRLALPLLAGGAGLALLVDRREVAPAAPAPASLPATLSGTGLYADPATRRLAPDVRPFSPQYPLWTDGAAKRRWIRLPAGTQIDGSDPDRWRFPVGTTLWKEFAFGRRVETRLIERLADGSWRFAAYLWDAEGRDATLAPEGGVRGAHPIAPGVAHDVPGRLDCLACHGDRSDPVLGFSALQLSSERDPLAPHAETPEPGSLDLATLRREGLLREAGAAAATADEALAPRIAARTARERAALGYLHGNCAACHRADGPLASLGLDLEARLADGGASRALPTALAQAARMRMLGTHGAALARLEPGDPLASLLFARASSRQALTQMPPLGTRLPDAEALALLEGWIREDLAPPGPISQPVISRKE